VILAGLFPVVADDTEPSFDPKGEIFETQSEVMDTFATTSSIRGVSFIIESPNGGDVLTRDALLELKQNQDAVLANAEWQSYLATSFDRELGITIEGMFSIVDAVDAELPGGLEAATDGDVKVALATLLADDSPSSSLRFLFSNTSTTREPTTIDGQTVVVWESPAFLTRLLFDIDKFDPDQVVESFGDDTNLDAERWLREVQTTLRGDQDSMTAMGVAMDFGLVAEEQTGAAGPFIFYAIAFILIFVGALLRSYWAAMLVGAGLGVTMMTYNGLNALIGLKTGSPLLIMIVPIALISFGVDFFIHGSGRAREMQVKGLPRERAYPLGMTAVSAALMLAALSSAAAFLSNTVSGIPAIIEFGVAAAIGLLTAYMVLGWVAPKLLLSMEERMGPRPSDLSWVRTVLQKIGFVIAAFIAGTAVTMAIVFPAVGWAAFLLFLALFIYLPYRLTRRRNSNAAEAGRPLTDEVKGAGHGFKAAGSLVHFLARWRVFTLPAVAILAVLGLYGATQVESGFEIKDFFSSNTDFVVSLDKLEEFRGTEGGGESDYIFIKGDLTSPDTLLRLETAQADINASDAEFVRDFNDDVEFNASAVTVVRLATDSEPMRAAVLEATGITITDANGDGLADAPEQVAAIYEYAMENDLVNNEGAVVFRPDQTETFLAFVDEGQATTLAVSIATFTDDTIILDAREALEDTAAGIEADIPGVTALVSGGGITGQESLDAFMSSMLTSLPVAVVLTSLLVFVTLFFIFRRFGRRMASVLKRSGRYALISMVPILLVVAWVYGFMYVVGYRINVITATIAAISIGVGVDYATHFTVRFIEEFEREPSRFPALRRAGEGTGGALAISAATSMTGFLVMATAPMPMFATFGVLTAVMIAFSLLVSLLVLPSLLLLITPSRKGAEREELIAAVTHGGEFEYEPHSRETAMRGAEDGQG
jgi:predicted RND superfamily exporter protein